MNLAQTKWVPQQGAFEAVKENLTTAGVLTHFNPDQKLILTCDASPYRVGAVISYQTLDGEKPIAFASRSLSQAERNYAQLDKEGLAIVSKSSMYLFGRQFEIQSDHKSLQHIFDSQRSIPSLASARIQRWALTLSGYDRIQARERTGKCGFSESPTTASNPTTHTTTRRDCTTYGNLPGLPSYCYISRSINGQTQTLSCQKSEL